MIDITGLKKSYGRLPVLKGLDLRIAPGAVTAVVGPNASGKTTLIKTILGLTRPDAGRLVFDGVELGGAGPYRERIGYMPQAARFPDNLTGREVIAMLKDLRPRTVDLDEELLDAFALDGELGKPLRTLSGGTRQKISAVIAFLFRPDVLILDEPTAGLDPVASSVLKDKIRRARDAGTTFILTSHIMSEIEALADHIAFLLDGTVRFCGSTASIKAATGEPHLERAIARLLTTEQAFRSGPTSNGFTKTPERFLPKTHSLAMISNDAASIKAA